MEWSGDDGGVGSDEVVDEDDDPNDDPNDDWQFGMMAITMALISTREVSLTSLGLSEVDISLS